MRNAVARIAEFPWSWRTVAPMACAVHCLVTPLLVAVAPTMLHTPAIEWTFFGVTGAFSLGVLRRCARSGTERLPSLLILIGGTVWAASLLHALGSIPEETSIALGALAVAGGLIWGNRKHRGHPGFACALPSRSDASPHSEASPRLSPVESQATVPEPTEAECSEKPNNERRFDAA